MNNYINFSYRISYNISAGSLQGTGSITNTSLSKIYISDCTFSTRVTDNTTFANYLSNTVIVIDSTTISNYGIQIPNAPTGYINSIIVSVQNCVYFKTGFYIQPGDQFRISGTSNINTASANAIGVFIYCNLVGYQID